MKLKATVHKHGEFEEALGEVEIEFTNVKSYEFKDEYFYVFLENGDVHVTKKYGIEKFSLVNE